MDKFNLKETIDNINKYKKAAFIEEINKDWIKPHKPFLMREPIHKEGMTLVEKIEYALFKKGFGGQKMFCKWYRTATEEHLNSIDLDVKDIKIEKINS